MNAWKKLAGVLAAGALMLAVAGPAAATVDYATVSGHDVSTSDNNKASFWGSDCVDLGIGGQDSYVLEASYAKVIVKAGSSAGDDPNSLTIFDNPTAGQTVWADSNGNNTYDVGGPGGDHQISHIIACGEVITTTTTTTTNPTTTTTTTTSATTTTATTTSATTTTTSFSQTVSATTDKKTLPNTAMAEVGGPSSPSSNVWLLIVALGLVLGSVVILTPAKAKAKR